MTMKLLSLGAFMGASALALSSGCGGGSSPLKTVNQSGTFFGESRTIGDGSARSFVTLDAGGNPTTVGIKFSAAALQGLPAPADPPVEYPALPLALPPQGAKTIFDHFSLDFEPEGHPPAPSYTVPHFDTHFYLLTSEEQAQITPGSDSSVPAPPPGVVPAPYISTGDTVPYMGVHWIDPTGPELNPPKPFSYTFIYGVDKGKLAFYEPMTAKSFLESKTSVTTPIKQPTVFQKSGYYPTQYSIRYDDAAKEYTIALENMVKH